MEKSFKTNHKDTGRPKWILYKHTSSLPMIKETALLVSKMKNSLDSNHRHLLLDEMENDSFYKTRNEKDLPLDSANHRINTLEYFMFGYEEKAGTANSNRFIFSPLGNMFLENINNNNNCELVFLTMLFGIQLTHPANTTPKKFQLFPFRLLLKLISEPKLNYKLYDTEYAYIVCFQETMRNEEEYENLIQQILAFRRLSLEDQFSLLKEDEITCVKSIYEWGYYIKKVLESAGIISSTNGEYLGTLYHPKKTNSKSKPTGRKVTDSFSTLKDNKKDFTASLLSRYSIFEMPLPLDSPTKMQLDVIKEIYDFYPELLLKAINQYDPKIQNCLNLPKLITQYSTNYDEDADDKFEECLTNGFNLFSNVKASRRGGAGRTDIECEYLSSMRKKKFDIEAKSRQKKLLEVNTSRLASHRNAIGGEYTIVITSDYTPAALNDICGKESRIVILLASTLSEYLYNYLFHKVRDIDFNEIDEIIQKHIGEDISPYVSQITMSKFGVLKKNSYSQLA